MIPHTEFNTTLVADAATGVADFYSLKQTQTVIKPSFYPLLCHFLVKSIIVINPVCARVVRSAEEDDFQGEGGGCVYLMILCKREVLCCGLSDITLPHVSLGFLRISF